MAVTHMHLRSKLLAPSVRKRIFGGFAVVLLLLVALAVVALQGMDAVEAGARRVSQDSAQAITSAEIALLVAEARVRVGQYALSATMEDQKAAGASLLELGQAIERSKASTGNGGRGLGPLAEQYRATVDTSIAMIEARRSGVEEMQTAATDLRTIVSATSQNLDSNSVPDLIVAAARLADTFGTADGAAFRFVASRTPREANAADSALHALRGAITALDAASADNRRVQRFLKGMADPLERLGGALRRVVATDEQLRIATEARDAASAAVLTAAAQQRMQAAASQNVAIAAMLSDTHSASLLCLLTAVLAIGTGLLLAWRIGSNIARPVGALTLVMRNLAKGSLEVAIPNAERRDELGEMARAVVVFKENALAVRPWPRPSRSRRSMRWRRSAAPRR
jgi:methyl-accepting chemotaxis protein